MQLGKISFIFNAICSKLSIGTIYATANLTQDYNSIYYSWTFFPQFSAKRKRKVQSWRHLNRLTPLLSCWPLWGCDRARKTSLCHKNTPCHLKRITQLNLEAAGNKQSINRVKINRVKKCEKPFHHCELRHVTDASAASWLFLHQLVGNLVQSLVMEIRCVRVVDTHCVPPH